MSARVPRARGDAPRVPETGGCARASARASANPARAVADPARRRRWIARRRHARAQALRDLEKGGYMKRAARAEPTNRMFQMPPAVTNAFERNSAFLKRAFSLETLLRCETARRPARSSRACASQAP